MFDPQTWAAVPFHFWSAVFFVLGSIVGSLLNVCIHRMPRGESIVSPPSHCPRCRYAIPWYLNIPLFTWICLRGKCANCGASISFRYFFVELLTGLAFLTCWRAFGQQSALLALVYCLLLSGFIVATFIDLEHFIIPDEITLGGIVAGFLCSAAVPALHATTAPAPSLRQSFFGIALGGGLVYTILRVAKIFLGRQRLILGPGTRVRFTETSLQLPDEEIPYETVLRRQRDFIAFEAQTVELANRGYFNVPVRRTRDLLRIGDDAFKPEEITFMEAVTDQIFVPREAMGLGGVIFIIAVGAFLGWSVGQGVFGIALGSVFAYAILRVVENCFGRQRRVLKHGTKIRFTESGLQLPTEEIPYGDLFYRKGDFIELEAKTVELADRCYFRVPILLTSNLLKIGEDTFNPEEIASMEVVTDQIIIPREAMGLGDVKFMAAIGAFLGWQAVLFSLTVSAFIGAFIGVTLIALKRKEWSSLIPYGPYIAVAATVWIFAGEALVRGWFTFVNRLWMKEGLFF